MEQENSTQPLCRRRSLQSVLAAGYGLYTGGLWRILRSSWVAALVYAVVVGLSMALFFTRLLPQLLSHGLAAVDGHDLMLWGCSLLASALAALLLAVCGAVAPLRDHSHTERLPQPRHWWGRWPWRLMLKTPLRLPAMALRTIKARQGGMLCAVLLVTALVVLIFSLLLELPAIVMAVADVEAARGIANGEAVELPSHTFRLNTTVFTLCALLQGYIHLAMLYPLYYVWGNVLSQTNTNK